MARLIDECAVLRSNDEVGPGLFVMELEAPGVAQAVLPGQFVHLSLPALEAHILRRPFSVYSAHADSGSLELLYQVVGAGTRAMAALDPARLSAAHQPVVLGPVGTPWSLGRLGAIEDAGASLRVLLVGGGVGSAPLLMLAERLHQGGAGVDVVLGARDAASLVSRERFAAATGKLPACATDDGSFGHPGFCTDVVEERLAHGAVLDGAPYTQVCVCGPEPLMRKVAHLAQDAGAACEVSLERRMACGVGACLSCIVETVEGKKRACVDGPIFEARKVLW